ncbi:hypothetical protein LX64_02012 [Chitinophaga skermanii]|uniref:Uncharacterized protein n=1 Tax=Chitinophaga skermanii TaxID=331697 RepID=A0A327QTA9_9BACT|nr:hypothetical protein LX64_02012 [Chitinophaga skermanii]
MSTQTLYGILFLLAGLFQLFTAFLIFQGNSHYMVRVAGKKVGMLIYIIFAVILFYLGYRHLR